MTKARDIADSDLGSLTVDTDTLVVDETNNRVGIGTSSPSSALDVQGDVGVSGGIYLGSTGSANKLDDYEEGTWTPFLEDFDNYQGASYSTQSGKYTKIGNVVYAEFSIFLNGFVNGRGGANMFIKGVPFALPPEFQGSVSYGELNQSYNGLAYGNGPAPLAVRDQGGLQLFIQDRAIEDGNFSGNESLQGAITFIVN